MNSVGILSFVIVLAVASYAIPVQNDAGKKQEEALTNYIREALENFRAQMKDGIPAINLPPVEPLQLKDQKVQVNEDHVELDLKLHEIKVVGLSLFEVQELVTDLPNLKVKAIFRFPLVSISGQYDVKGKVLKFVPIYGDGNYNVTITGAEVGGSTSLLLGEETMEITPPKLHVKWTNIKMDLGNFLGGGSFGETIQKVLSSLGPTLFEKYREQILELAGNSIAKEANQALNTDKVKEMVGKILAGFMGARF